MVSHHQGRNLSTNIAIFIACRPLRQFLAPGRHQIRGHIHQPVTKDMFSISGNSESITIGPDAGMGVNSHHREALQTAGRAQQHHRLPPGAARAPRTAPPEKAARAEIHGDSGAPASRGADTAVLGGATSGAHAARLIVAQTVVWLLPVARRRPSRVRLSAERRAPVAI